jgi:hypothetical protein
MTHSQFSILAAGFSFGAAFALIVMALRDSGSDAALWAVINIAIGIINLFIGLNSKED